MRLNDFERILAEKILEDINWKEPVLDRQALKAEQIESFLTSRLKSWEFSPNKTKTSQYRDAFQAFDSTKKQSSSQEGEKESQRGSKHDNDSDSTRSNQTQTTKNQADENSTIEETRIQTEALDLVDRIYIQKLIEMGAPERLYFSFTQSELKKAYRQLAFKFHPDQGGAVEKFIFLGEAFQALEKYL